MMMSIEEIAEAIEALPSAIGDAWTIHSLVPDRIHLSRGQGGEYSIFIEGPLESFGTLPPFKGLAHSACVTAVPSRRVISALRLQSSDDHFGNRVMAHIAYELAGRLQREPATSNQELLASVAWALLLLGNREGVLTPERQAGLVGECLLLRALLVECHAMGLPPKTALDRWWGHGRARRDFAAKGVSIEVKTTSRNYRVHAVGMEQLDPSEPGEVVFLFSIGLKTDPTANRKLPDYIEDVECQLVAPSNGARDEQAIERFREQLHSYGYDSRLQSLYRASPGYPRPHLSPALFAVKDLDRLQASSFAGGRPPPTVSAVHYDLTITCPALSDLETTQVLRSLLMNPPSSVEADDPSTGVGRKSKGSTSGLV